jgi:hypothetical protein
LISKQNDNALYYFGENHAKKKKNRGEKIEKKKEKERKEEWFSRAIWELYRDHTPPNKKVPTEVIPPIAGSYMRLHIMSVSLTRLHMCCTYQSFFFSFHFCS